MSHLQELAGAPSRGLWTVPRAASAATAERLETLIREDGVRAMLAALNARTRYRFTGLYRLDPPRLRNIALYDRENPSMHLGGDINTLRETWCAVIAATGRPFSIENADADRTVADHPARLGVVRAYLGVPILAADGTVWGTLCHYDLRPRLISAAEIGVLECAAALLSAGLAAA